MIPTSVRPPSEVSEPGNGGARVEGLGFSATGMVGVAVMNHWQTMEEWVMSSHSPLQKSLYRYKTIAIYTPKPHSSREGLVSRFRFWAVGYYETEV